MMGSRVLRVTYRAAARPALRIEQVPWDALAERRPRFDQWLLEEKGLRLVDLEARRQWLIIDRYQQEYLSWCSADDGSFQARIRVFREPGLRYEAWVSHGRMDAPVRVEEPFSEPMVIRNASEVEIRDADILAWGWDAPPRRLDGSVMSPAPVPELLGSKAVFPEPVGLGVARVEAVRSYDEYVATIPPRPVEDLPPGFAATGSSGPDGSVMPSFAAQARLATRADLYRSTFAVWWREESGEDRMESIEIEPPGLADDVHAADPRDPEYQEPEEGGDGAAEVVVAPYLYCTGHPVEQGEIRLGDQVAAIGEAMVMLPGRDYPMDISGPDIISTRKDSLLLNDTLRLPDQAEAGDQDGGGQDDG